MTRTGAAAAGDGPVAPAGETEDRAPRSARWLVGFLFVALLTPGVIGFELWPMTGWRLFSLPRTDTGTFRVLEGVAEDGSTRLVDLDDLPLGYKYADWPMREADWDSADEAEEICQTLADAALELDPDLVELRIVRERQRIVREGDEGEGQVFVRSAGDRVIVAEDREVLYSCIPASGGEADEP